MDNLGTNGYPYLIPRYLNTNEPNFNKHQVVCPDALITTVDQINQRENDKAHQYLKEDSMRKKLIIAVSILFVLLIGYRLIILLDVDTENLTLTIINNSSNTIENGRVVAGPNGRTGSVPSVLPNSKITVQPKVDFHPDVIEGGVGFEYTDSSGNKKGIAICQYTVDDLWKLHNYIPS